MFAIRSNYKLYLILFTILLYYPLNAHAISYSGCIGTTDVTNGNCAGGNVDGQIIGFGDWQNASTISWEVNDTDNIGYWTYSYFINVGHKDINDVIFETHASFTNADILGFTSSHSVSETETKLHGNAGTPNLPEDFYGTKLEIGPDTLSFSFSFYTTFAPGWGDFYARDGRLPQQGDYVTLSNLGFTSPDSDPLALASNGSLDNHLLLPMGDTEIPEPASALLLGTGIAGLSRLRKKRS